VTAQQRLAFAAVADEAALQEPWTARDREICDLVRAGFRGAAGAALRQYLDDSERLLVQLTRGA
jgi:DNA-binding FadR family transcriptional regulator